MLGRSRITISQSLRCPDGARRVFTDHADICLHQARSAVRCSASRITGGLRPTKNLFRGGHSCIRMTSVKSNDCFPQCGHFQRQQWGCYVTGSASRTKRTACEADSLAYG
ncbi:unnamed protein product [Laminaria digitata]